MKKFLFFAGETNAFSGRRHVGQQWGVTRADVPSAAKRVLLRFPEDEKHGSRGQSPANSMEYAGAVQSTATSGRLEPSDDTVSATGGRARGGVFDDDAIAMPGGFALSEDSPPWKMRAPKR